MSTARDESSGSSEHRRLLRCVNCAREMPSLHVQYSPGNIRLMKCVSEAYGWIVAAHFLEILPLTLSFLFFLFSQEHCKAVADPYIECEFMVGVGGYLLLLSIVLTNCSKFCFLRTLVNLDAFPVPRYYLIVLLIRVIAKQQVFFFVCDFSYILFYLSH